MSIEKRKSEMPERRGFTDGMRRIATDAECNTKWAGAGPGERFRCNLCGHKFVTGDGWRWQYVGPLRQYDMELLIDGKPHGVCNFMVCDACDGPDVIARWVERHKEFYSDRFWAIRH